MEAGPVMAYIVGHGSVENKILARECKLCGQQVPAAKWNKHTWGVEHTENERLLHRDVLVAGFPSDTKQRMLREIFSKYGTIEHSIKDGDQKRKCVVIHFQNESSADEVLLRKHALGRHELNVVARHPNLLLTPLRSKELLWSEFVLNYLLTKRSLSQQLAYIANDLAMLEEEQQHRGVFCEKLEEKFREFVPTCRLIPFGPSVNGLGTKGCDLDLFLDLKVPTVENKISVDMEKICENLELVRLAPDKSGFITLIGSLGMVEVVEVFSAILQKYVPGCLDVVAQASARCPTIRFHSQGLQIDCEIAVNNVLALQNTSLICFYNKLDERFQSLYYALYYWMTYHNFGNSKKGRFSKYALSMLIIFYLQSCSPPILPTVEELQKLETDDQPVSDGWECRFCTDVDKVQRKENQRSIGYLFANFFNFYTDHKLDDKVICVRTGKFLSKEEFKTINELHKNSSKLAKFKMGHIAVQDPFELNRNITANVTEDVFHEFLDAIQEATKRSTSNTYWTKAEHGNIWGFPYVLCDDVGRFLATDAADIEDSGSEAVQSFTVTISFKAGECCNYVIVGRNFAQWRRHSMSCSRRICRIIREILTRGYQFTLKDSPDDNDCYEEPSTGMPEPMRRRVRTRRKRRRLVPPPPFNQPFEQLDDGKPLDEYLIETNVPVWWNRDEIRMQLGEGPMDLVGNEGAITDIVKTLYRQFLTDVPLCECLCTLTPLFPPSDVCVALTVEPLHLTGRSDWRKSFHEFFENDIPNLVRKVIAEQISTVAVVEVS